MDDAAFAVAELRDTLETGRGTYTDLSFSYRDWVQPPDLMIGEVTPALMRQYFEQHSVIGTTLYDIRNVDIIGEGIIIVDDVFQYCGQLNVHNNKFDNYYKHAFCGRSERQRVTVADDVVLLGGMGYHIYGHWLIDFLPKLYLLDRAGYDIARLRYLLAADTPAFARTWLRLLGIPDDRLVVYDPGRDLVTCSRLLIPTALRFGSRASPLLRDARRFLLERAAPAPAHRRFRFGRKREEEARPIRKLLIVRSENNATFNRRHLVEREAFETKAVARGFEPVRPELLTIPEQIALFRSAATIYGEYGSGMHGSFFSPAGTTVVSVRDNGLELGFLQSSFDHVLDHASGYLIGSARSEDGSFSVRSEHMDFAFDWLEWRGLR